MKALRTLMVAAALVLPVAFSGTAIAGSTGNESDVHLSGNGNAVAICQFAILINSALILDVEDSLGLVGAPPRVEALPDLVRENAEVRTATATCSTTLRNVNITVRGAPPSLDELRPGGVVLGPPPNVALAQGANQAGNTASLQATGDGNSVAVCQFLVLVNTVIVGGGTAGLATGAGPTTHTLSNDSGTSDSQAECKTILENVKIRVLST